MEDSTPFTPTTARKHKNTKKLVMACDGTWMTPSNVTRICRALLPESEEGVQQIVYYQAGIGTESTFWNHVVGGGTGAGLSENIREAYAFLATNYEEGDEIILLGFSRGAFTARSIAGFIDSIGLLTSRGMEDFYPIFMDWENQNKPHYRPRWPARPFPDRPNAASPEYAEKLASRNLTRLNITIKAVGVWDTVGSLGIPALGFLPAPKHQEFSFFDTRVSDNVEHAFHALALDEHRKPFSPSIWEHPGPQAKLKVMKQVWFPGVHSNVGGSYDDTNLADISLAWMMDQLSPFLDFSSDYLEHIYDQNNEHYKDLGKTPRHWSTGKIYNSATGIQLLAGTQVRTPGRYHVDGQSGRKLLQNTCESVHASVRFRMGLDGLGTEDKGRYTPTALKGWTTALGQDGKYKWVYEDKTTGQAIELPEDEIGEVELDLLRRSAVAKAFLEGRK